MEQTREMWKVALSAKQIADLVLLPAIVVDIHAAIIAANSEAQDIGFLIGKNIGGIPQITDSAKLSDSLMTCFNQQKRTETLIGVNVRDQKREYRAVCVPVAEDEPSGVTLITFYHEDKSEEMIERLVAGHKFLTIGRLAAGVMHEIRSPIQYIGDNVRFVMESTRLMIQVYNELSGLVNKGDSSDLCEKLYVILNKHDFEDLMEDIQPALTESQEGVRQIRYILDAMKRFSHPGYDHKEWVNVNDLIKSALTITHGEWKNYANLRLDLDPTLPEISVLRDEISQVFLNLLVNAAQAIQKKKESIGEKGEISIRTQHDNSEIIIHIRDSGTGIPQGLIGRIFEPFFTTKKPGEGTGQGLSLVQQIISRHRGQIKVTSEDMVGTQFEISLPLIESSE